MLVCEILKHISSDYQIRINSLMDFRRYCSRYSDEIKGADLFLSNTSLGDYDYKAEIDKIVTNNNDSFQWSGDEIILKTGERGRIINLEVKDIRAENDMIVLVVKYGSTSDDDYGWKLR